MKEHLAGIGSAVMLVCILVGNTVFSVFSGTVPVQQALGEQDIRALSVLTYHNVLEQPRGQETVSISQLKQDLEYLKNRGYTTVSTKQVEEYLTNQQPLPEKPVMITFDGGTAGVYHYAFPILMEYEACAVVNIRGKYTDLYSYREQNDPEFAYLSWDQLREMTQYGVFEVGNETYDLETRREGKSFLMKQDGESAEEYRAVVADDIGSLKKQIETELEVEASIFALPTKEYEKDCETILEELKIKVVFTNDPVVNLLGTGKRGDGLIILNRIPRDSASSTRQAMTDAGIQ